MMPNRSTDILFQLIHSLEKAEKRHFKLYINRSSAKENLKIVQVFDALDRMEDYDERLLMKRLSGVTKPQLANLKTHLYKQILSSLRLLKSADSLDLQLNELFDNAHILYKKGLFIQSLRVIDKAKELAHTNQKYFFLPQIIALEKRIETLHVTGNYGSRTIELSVEANEVNRKLDMISRLSDVALQIYGFYIQHGHARNEKDEQLVKDFLKDNLPKGADKETGFYERLYLYQIYTWSAFIRQDFILYYKYTQKWVDLYLEQPDLQRVETGHYIKGLHNLLNAHFDLRNYEKFEIDLKRFEKFAETKRVQQSENFKVQSFVYIASARINFHNITGTFKEGLKLVPGINEKMEEYSLFLDKHRIMVVNYKIATLYFGSGDYSTCIDYLQTIINEHAGLRSDLQCYARLLHLLAHFELGNMDLMDHLTRSVYRYMSKMENLTMIEEEMFKFFRNSFKFTKHQQRPELEKFLEKVKHLEGNRFETRAFAYLDIISWLESKVQQKPMSEIIHTKYLKSKKRRYQKAK
ncbi:hypothetical protein ACFS6H_03310 [Terrimonas rubra]|uniref:Tetratricopeptide repeat protein n=1 Tax=Terrimonas rubra TaxID=1035890 RepID=A0ABW6A379_9BACT